MSDFISIRYQHITNEDDRRESSVHAWRKAVPRVGEYVEVRDVGQPPGMNTLLRGKVRTVMWDADGAAVVKYR